MVVVVCLSVLLTLVAGFAIADAVSRLSVQPSSTPSPDPQLKPPPSDSVLGEFSHAAVSADSKPCATIAKWDC